MDAQQELFSYLMHRCDRLTDVYDGDLPPAGVSYPFIYMADAWQSDTGCKTGEYSTVTQTVHVYHDRPDKRGDLSALLYQIKTIAKQLYSTPSYQWLLQDCTIRVLSDNSTDQPLVHGIVELKYLATRED